MSCGGPHILELASKNSGLSILDVMWWSCMNWQCLEVLLMHVRGENECATHMARLACIVCCLLQNLFCWSLPSRKSS